MLAWWTAGARRMHFGSEPQWSGNTPIFHNSLGTGKRFLNYFSPCSDVSATQGRGDPDKTDLAGYNSPQFSNSRRDCPKLSLNCEYAVNISVVFVVEQIASRISALMMLDSWWMHSSLPFRVRSIEPPCASCPADIPGGVIVYWLADRSLSSNSCRKPQSAWSFRANHACAAKASVDLCPTSAANSESPIPSEAALD